MTAPRLFPQILALGPKALALGPKTLALGPKTLALGLAVAALWLAAPAGVAADGGPFAPALYVNNRAITNYEIEQRARFMTLLHATGDIRAEAEKALIEDRLRLDAAEADGIKLSPQQIRGGMEEFAARANLNVDQFIAAIAPAGVEPETFRDFVEAGLVWRELIKAKFGPRTTVSQAEIARATSAVSGRGAGIRVLLSEIVLPTSFADAQKARRQAVALTKEPLSEAAFAEAARTYSAAPTRASGGKVNWIPLSNLPPQVRGMMLTMRPGQVTPPVTLPGQIVIYQLRGIQQGSDKIAASQISVEYAQLLIAGAGTAAAAAEAARIRGNADTCDDLYRAAKAYPAAQLTRQTMAQTAVPGDIAGELAHLDENEISTGLVRGNAQVLLMLCKRTAVMAEGAASAAKAAADAPAQQGLPMIVEDASVGMGPDGDVIHGELANQKLSQISDGYLALLMADAVIRRP